MAVNLTVSESIDGAAVSDVLAGGGGSNTGVDLGSVVNGSYAPVTDKSANTGRQDLFVHHDATIDPITDLKCYLGQYGAETSYAYGGADSAANDYIKLKNLAQASGSSKNNGDGNSGGVWMDFDWDVSDANQFDHSTRPTLVKLFGDNGTDGIDLASAFGVPTDSMVYDNAGTETAASAPVAGSVGKAGDTALGTNAHLRTRIYLPQTETQGGILQWEYVFAYSYTA